MSEGLGHPILTPRMAYRYGLVGLDFLHCSLQALKDLPGLGIGRVMV